MDVQGGGSRGGGGGVGVAKTNDPTTASSVDDLQDSLDKFIQLIYQSTQAYSNVISYNGGSTSNKEEVLESEATKVVQAKKALLAEINSLIGADKSKEELLREIDSISNEFEQVKRETLQYESALRLLASKIDDDIERELEDS